MKIESSERLSYMLMSKQDSELLFELDQDPEVMRYITGGEVTSREILNEILLPRMESYRNLSEGWGIWKVSITKTKKFIGWILVRPMNFFSEQPEFDNLEIGWRFSRDYWGNGYATEAAKSIKEVLASKDYVNKLSAIAVEDNKASVNIMKKLGMKYVKTDIHRDILGEHELVFYEWHNN